MKYTTEGICVACTAHGAVDLHHVKSRKAGGSDDKDNLLELCRKCHSEIHNIGRTTFIKKYDLAPLMYAKNWCFDEFLQKWWRITDKGIIE